MENEGVKLMDLLNNIEPAKVEKTLASLSKYENLIEKLSNLIDKLGKHGIINAVIHGASKKMGVDLSAPASNPLMIVASSPFHYTLFEELNNLSKEEIVEIMKAQAGLVVKNDKNRKD